MRQARIMTAALSVVIVAPAAAPAQNFRDGVQSSGADPLVRRVLHDYGVCAAKGMPIYARRMLSLDPGTREYGVASRRLAEYSGRCLSNGGRLQMGGLLFAGSLAEGMLMNDAGNAGWEQRVAYDASRPAYNARGEGDVIGACTVQSAPAAVRTLFESETSSAAEAAAVKALTPTVQGCVREGLTTRLDTTTLRSLLAISAYRMSQPMAANIEPKGS